MESTTPSRRPPNPWSFIWLSALVPLLCFLFVLFKWYRDRTDFRKTTSQFVQRQNTVMAYDAMEVSTGFGDLLEKAGRDVEILSVVPVTGENLLRFFRAQTGDYTRYDTKNDAVIEEPLPFYNRVAVYDAKGTRLLQVLDGKIDSSALKLSDCRLADLCDHELIEKATQLKSGELHYGTLMRYYSPKGVDEDFTHAGLAVAYRTVDKIYLLSIEYRHLKDHLTSPAFPYDPKRNLLEAYHKGNYLYITDSNTNMLTHPHYWNVMGVDRTTGRWMPSMREDSDSGQRPINIAAYQKGILKDYFTRLLKTSFTQKGVDIFPAPNLAGNSRILSVAPVLVSKGQYKASGVFGHVVVSCSVDYFEEPKEMIVPYY